MDRRAPQPEAGANAAAGGGSGLGRVALVIPTLDAGPHLDRLLPALAAQSLQPERFLVIDSESEDETAARLTAAGAEVLTIERAAFDHGGTRQMALESLADADIVLFLTQDAVPAGPEAFARLVAAFAEPEIGCAYGRQLPAPDATPVAAHARLFNYPETSETRSLAAAPVRGIKTAFCSNSFAAWRRQALLGVGGFPTAAIVSEDMLAAGRLLAQGWRLRYVAEATVTHSHNYAIAQEFRRYFDIGVLHARQRAELAPFGRAEGEGLKFLRSEFGYLARRAPAWIPGALVRAAMKYVGYRLGRGEAAIPLAVRRRLSLHRGYWR